MIIIKKCIIALYEFILSSEIIMEKRYKEGHASSLKIMNSEETLNYIIDKKCSVSRFGEGELELILHSNIDLGFQHRNPLLSEALKRVLGNNDENLLICLPNALNTIKGRTKHSRQFWYYWSNHDNQREKTEKLVRSMYSDKDKVFGDTQISRPYIAFKNSNHAERIFTLLKEIWNNRDLLLVEGELTRLGVGNNMFTNAKSIKRILCPATDAFDYYQIILQRVVENWKGELVLLALGPTATILAADLSRYGIQAIDVGHLDIEYEWYLSGANEHSKVKGKYTNESQNGCQVEECNDLQYLESIIDKVGE